MRRTVFTQGGLVNLLALAIRDFDPEHHQAGMLGHDRLTCVLNRLMKSCPDGRLTQAQGTQLYEELFLRVPLTHVCMLPDKLIRLLSLEAVQFLRDETTDPYVPVAEYDLPRILYSNALVSRCLSLRDDSDDCLKYIVAMEPLARKVLRCLYHMICEDGGALIPSPLLSSVWESAMLMYAVLQRSSAQVQPTSIRSAKHICDVCMRINDRHGNCAHLLHLSTGRHVDTVPPDAHGVRVLEWLSPSVHMSVYDVSDILKIYIDRHNIVSSSVWGLLTFKMSGLFDKWARSPGAGIDIRFNRESGYGSGVVREWLSRLMDGLLSMPSSVLEDRGGLLCVKQHGVRSDGPNCESGPGDPDSSRFADELLSPSKLAWVTGIVIGLSIRTRSCMNVCFSRALLLSLQCCTTEIGLDEVHETDPGVARVGQMVLDASSQEDLDALGLSQFQVGETALMPGGAHVSLTRDNRRMYVKLLARYVSGVTANQDMLWMMQQGLRQVIGGKDWQKWSLFNNRFRSLPACAINNSLGNVLAQPIVALLRNSLSVEWDAEIDPLRADTLVRVLFSHLEAAAQGREYMQHLLRFWTGSPVLTRDTKMQLYVEADSIPSGRMPSSHTCYHQLRLPMPQGIERNAVADAWECIRRLDCALEMARQDHAMHDDNVLELL